MCKANSVVDIYQLWEKFAFLIVRINIFFYHEGGRRYIFPQKQM